MSIPQDFIDELVSRCDILDIVSRYVTLKKSGSAHFGLCPFHNEKTPSFSVNRERQIFHCFGCGEGGGVIGFIMKIEGLDFVDAVKFLADIAGMKVPDNAEQSSETHKRRQRILELNIQAARFFHDCLLGEQGKAAREYIAKRELSKKTVNNFGLGFAPDSWDSLITAMTALGFSKSELIDAGLVSKNDKGGIYDKFRNRLMFPIIDIGGKVIAFGGRVLDDSLPKYLNSPETLVFSKSKNLFAFNRARRAKSRRIILAEGYMDVITLHQAGFETAVASLGTSLTEEQARLISRYADEVVIVYDSDTAGRNATSRAIEIFKKTEVKVRVLTIPGAKDPDEYIKKNGSHAFDALLNKSETKTEYGLNTIAQKYDLTTDDGRLAFIKEAVSMLARYGNSVEREIYAARAAEMAGVSAASVQDNIRREIARLRKRRLSEEKKKILQPSRSAQPAVKKIKYDNIRSALAEEGIISIGFSDEQLLAFAAEKLSAEDFSCAALGEIFGKMCSLSADGRHISLDALSQEISAESLVHMSSILAKPPPVDAKRAMNDYIDIVKLEGLKKSDADVLDTIAQGYRKTKGYGGNRI